MCKKKKRIELREFERKKERKRKKLNQREVKSEKE